MLTVRYFDRAQEKMVRLDIPAAMGVLNVEIPAQPEEGLPALDVSVNTDAILVNALDGPRLGGLEYTDLLAGAAKDGIEI